MDTIDESLQQLQELFQNIMATLREEKEQLHVAIQCFELVCTVICGAFYAWKPQERQQVATSNVLQTERVKVDVGGRPFHVSRSVLTSVPNSMLESLFSGRFRVDTQADGSVFIDRHVGSRLHACSFF